MRQFLKRVLCLGLIKLDWLVLTVGPKKEKYGVLVVRVDAIGDFILWFESARSLRERYKDQKMVLICNQTVAELARECGLFDEVIPVDLVKLNRHLFYRWRMLRKVRRLGATTAIQPTYSRVFLSGDAFIRASQASKRIGSVGDCSNISPWLKSIGDRWYTHLVDASPAPMMELERNAEFLRGVGINEAKPRVANLPVLTDLSPELRPTGDYFILFPGASSPHRMWPVQYFAEIAETVTKHYGWHMVVCGTRAESQIAKSIVETSGLTGASDLSGRTTLAEFVELVRGARLLVGNETSAVHIAAAVHTPSVCILGGGHYGRFMPYSEVAEGMKPGAIFHRMECFNCNWRCVKPHEPGSCLPCVKKVSVEAVAKAITETVNSEEV